MTVLRSHKVGSKRGRRGKGRRGSVIVLVVAVLGLLAVIGTVYVVSSRSGHGSATASNVAANLDLAQRAVNEQVSSIIGSPPIDAAGNVGGYSPGFFGSQVGRNWDIPELNVGPPLNTNNMGYTYYNGVYRDQTWLVSNLYRPTAALTADYRFNDMTLLTNMAFNPATGSYDIPFYNPGTSVFNPNVNLFRVVADPLPAAMGADAFMQLLPFSEASGVRYRVGVRIIDTSRMANLNVGSTVATPDTSGAYYTSYMLNVADIFDTANTLTAPGGVADVPADLDGIPALNNAGRLGNIASDYTTWKDSVFRFENPSLKNTLPFDLSDELALRSYGSLGTLFMPRVAMRWPNNLANTSPVGSTNIVGNGHRGNYTAYSYSRELRPYTTAAAYTLSAQTPISVIPPTGTNSIAVWPAHPARVGVNMDLTTAGITDPKAADYLAIAATNIGTAMEFAGYTHHEARAFAANYITYRWNSWVVKEQQTYKAALVNVYMMPMGPSFVDGTGICIRNGVVDREYGSVTDLKGTKNTPPPPPPNVAKVYMGYAAQPFINEVVATIGLNAGTPETTDFAVELYNPYNVALSLEDYKLNINGIDYLFTGKNWWVPPRGYFVLTKAGSYPVANVDAQNHADVDFQIPSGPSANIYLMRRYTPRGAATATAWAAVDAFNATNVATHVPAAGPPVNVFAARNNLDDGTGATNLSRWVATVHTVAMETARVDAGAAPARMSLGDKNDDDGTITNFVPLYDRVIDNDNVGVKRQPFFNIADFNRIMRICNEIDTGLAPIAAPATTDPLEDHGVISSQMFTAQVVGTQFAADAGVHFDFRAAPALFAAAGIPDFPNPNAIAPGYALGDIRATRLLNYLAFVDRVADYEIDLVGDNHNNDQGRSKIRIPGQINVNTASAEVLATIPALAAQPQYIGAILAYRWRTTTTDPRIMALDVKFRTQPYDFSTVAEFPGYGIRTLGELHVPLTANFTATSQTSTLDDRDQVWARVYNYLTVRSDTFAVYAYLEAVKQNPRYNGATVFNNGTHWYLPMGAGVTDDPTDTTSPLIRVAAGAGFPLWIGHCRITPWALSSSNPASSPRRICRSKAALQ